MNNTVAKIMVANLDRTKKDRIIHSGEVQTRLKGNFQLLAILKVMRE